MIDLDKLEKNLNALSEEMRTLGIPFARRADVTAMLRVVSLVREARAAK